ncbi:DinB family protein [Paenibacillus andongensis]|uniref:DinB family protein n=1 Tax=Paenibacillus andongensis TaxID=2975482 RepID=UPI0021BB595C|nr:DinB family protein [Paenibacillus andongensis]
MNEKQIFNKFKKIRTETLNEVRDLPNNIIDLIPEGFSNNIRWNLGHILVGWDHGIFPNIKLERRESLHYHTIFPKGTVPKECWGDEPVFKEIVSNLENQLESIIENSKGKLEQPLIVPFIPRVKTIKNMFQFHIKHEEHHLECIRKIKQILINE